MDDQDILGDGSNDNMIRFDDHDKRETKMNEAGTRARSYLVMRQSNHRLKNPERMTD